MQSIATLEIGPARELAERLSKAGISTDLRSAADESGLELTEVLVEERSYDQACDVAEAWEAEQRAKAGAARRCPKCRSRRLEYAPRDRLEDVYRCKDCGCEITF